MIETACGEYFSIALKSDGTLTGWGDNIRGLTNVPPQATDVVSITSRGFDCLALRRDGLLVAWGDDTYIPPGATGIVAIATGAAHHLALRQDGELLAWGANNYGQCNIPLDATNIIAIGAGYTHSLALRKDGHLVAWGENTSGDTDIPAGATNIVSITVGPDFNLALRADGQIFAWGLDWGGNAAVPADATNVVAIAAGENPDFAIRADGSVSAWGRNDNGEVNVPAGLAPAFSISAGTYHSLGIRVVGPPGLLRQPNDRIVSAGDSVLFNAPAIGQVPLSYQWRFNGAPIPGETSPVLLMPAVQGDKAGNYDLIVQNGSGSVTSRVASVTILPAKPTVTLDPTSAVVSLGGNSTFFVRAKGTSPLYFQWQHNGHDLSGETNSVLSLANIALSDAGSYHAIVSNSLGSATSADAVLEVVPVFAWGTDQSGVLDLPFGLTNATALAAGQSHNLALKADGTVVGWGDNGWTESTPAPGVTNIIAIAAGNQSSLALRNDGAAISWGLTYVAPDTATNIAAVAVGSGGYNLVLSSNGLASSWGDYWNPSPPANATNLIAIAAGNVHSLGLRQDGSLLGWGSQAAPPAGVSNFIAIAAGDGFSVGLQGDGRILAWGYNTYGQTNIPPEATNIIAIAAGNSHVMAVRDDGRVLVWGNTNSGVTSIPPALTYPSSISAGSAHCLALMDLGPLRFSRQPFSRTNSAGDRTLLSAAAIGAGPMSYQWVCNGTNITGATHAYFTINDTQQPDGANYSIIVSNSFGSITSQVATITVAPRAPFIINQPTNQQELPGHGATFNVLAQGTEPMGFQWYFNNALITNAVSSILTLTNAQVADSGNYQVVITNTVGAVTSVVAHLDVFPLNLLTAFTNAAGTWSGAWGDFDNDGRLDLLVAGKAGGNLTAATTRLFRNLGNGSFVETNVGLGQAAIGVAWADFDNDGLLDIVLTTFGGAAVYRNTGNGSFTNLNISMSGDSGTAATVADFDNDGRPDILLGGRMYRNFGGNHFTNVNIGLPSFQNGCTAWGDYDNDGRPDILACGLSGANAKAQLFHNLGNGTFTNVNVGFTNLYRGSVAWIDFDGDGKLDALISGQTGPGVPVIALYRNNGDGTFTSVTNGLPAFSLTSLAVGDFDNDGQPDLFHSGNNGAVYSANIYHGSPTGLFTPIMTGMPTNLAPVGSWGDYDGDGRLDLAMSTSINGQTVVGIYRNDSPATNTPPTAPTNLATDAGLNAIHFSWTAGTDGQTVPSALTYNLRIGHTPGGSDVLAPNADASGLRRVASPGNAGETTTLFLTNLTFGQYYWSVQTVDFGFEGSPFPTEASFTYACFTQPPTNITASQATLLGAMTANGFPTAAYFEWGTGTNFSNRTPDQFISAAATNTTVTAPLAGLLPGNNYVCRLVVSNQLARSTGGTQSFTTINIPQISPQITTSLSATGATLNATVTPNGSPTTVYFEYGLSTAYGNASTTTNIGSGWTPLSVSRSVTGLIGGQIYHYHTVASNAVGVAYSADLTFATTTEPEVATLAATNIGPVSATLNANVRPNTLSTIAYFEYGLTTNYGSISATQALGNGTNLVPVAITVTNLTRVTTYHYRAVATNSTGLIYGADRSFLTTNDVIVLPATGIGMTNATLNGLVNPNNLATSVVFEYGTNTNYGTTSPLITLPATNGLVPVSCDLGGLTPGVTYYFRLSATNTDGVRQSGTLTFQALPQFSVLPSGLAGSIGGSIAWGDFYNNGKLDMLVSDSTSTRIYHNLGGGSFVVSNTAIPAVTGGSVVCGDFNNDGWLDVLVTGTIAGSPSTRIYRNTGNGTFTNQNAALPAIAFRSVSWGDFDNDGRPDVLLVGDTNSVGLSLIYHNNGDGTFQDSHATLPGFLDATAANADYDNDGRLDVLLAGRLGIEYSNVFAQVFHNDGSNNFHQAATTLDGVRGGYADWGDLDGDGWMDLVIGGNGTGLGPILRVYRNNHDGTFTNLSGTLPQFAPDAVLWGDFDNDGRPDVLVRGQQFISSVVPSNSYSGVLHNNGDGTFTALNFALPELWSSSGGWADYDNNGRLDAVISGNSRTGAQMLLYRNNNPGSNSPPGNPLNLSSTVSTNSVVLAWQKPTDLPIPGEALSYNVRVGVAPGGGEVLSPSSASNGWRRLVKMGNAGTSLVLPLNNLVPGTYYWSVQAIGAAFAGSSFATNATFTILHPPIAIPDSISTPTNTPVSFPASNLVANDIDLAALPLTVVSVATNSTNGGLLSLVSGTITYTPPTNYNGNDTFLYTVSNGQTPPSTGTVTATVGTGGIVPLAVISKPATDQGDFVMRLAGVPGLTYTVEAATNLSGPWTKLLNLTAPVSDQGLGVGGLEIRQPINANTYRFYRVIYPSY